MFGKFAIWYANLSVDKQNIFTIISILVLIIINLLFYILKLKILLSSSKNEIAWLKSVMSDSQIDEYMNKFYYCIPESEHYKFYK